MNPKTAELLQQIEKSEGPEKRKLLGELVKLKDPEAIDFLKKILPGQTSSADVFYIKKTIKFLNQLGETGSAVDSQAISDRVSSGALRDKTIEKKVIATEAFIFDSPDPEKRIASIRNALSTNADGKLEAFLELLSIEKDVKVLATLVKAIGKCGTKENIQHILPLLKHPDARIRSNTIEGIAFIDDPECIDYLIPLTVDEDSRVAAGASKVLFKFGNREVIMKIGSMLFEKDPSKVQASIHVLAEIADKEAISLIKKVSQGVSPEVQVRIDKILEKIEETENSTLPDQREIAQESVQALAFDSEDPERRIQAILASQSNPDSLPEMVKNLEKETNNKVIATYVKAIGNLGGKDEIKVISPFLKSSDARVRANTVEGLELIDDIDIVDEIFPLLSDKDSRVKANAAKLLWKFGRREVILKIGDMLFSDEEWVMDSAIYALSEIADKNSIQIIREVASNASPKVQSKVKQIVKLIEKKKGLSSKEDFEEFFQENKILVIASVIVLILGIVFNFTGGGDSTEINKNIDKLKKQVSEVVPVETSNGKTKNDADGVFKKPEEFAVYYCYLAMELESKGNYSAAEKQYLKALSYFEDFSIHLKLGELYMKLRKNDKARNEFETAVKLGPERLDVLEKTGDFYREIRNFDVSTNYYNKYLKINSDNEIIWSNLGVNYFSQKNYSEAEKCYRKAVSLNSSLIVAYNNLGTLYQITKKNDLAIEVFERALMIDPNYVEALYNVSLSYLEKKEFSKVKESLKKVISLDPSSHLAENAGVALNELEKQMIQRKEK